jgi:hypothetical protein
MSWLLLDYSCPDCSKVTEHFADRKAPEPTIACSCGGVAVRCLSPTPIKTDWGYVDTGKSEPRPPHILNTDPDSK